MALEPYYQDDAVTIYHGDSGSVASSLLYDVIATDPPWGISARTDSRRFVSQSSSWWAESDRSKVVPRDPITGDDKPFDPLPWIDRPAILWGAHCYASRLPDSAGWLVWDKRQGLEGIADKGWPLGEAELAWTNIRASTRVFRNRWAGLVRSSERREHYHPTQKPVSLMKWCLGFLPEGTVLDPFMGSGTTLRAAKDLGRKAIGIEIEERYCEIAARRCAQEVLDL